MYDIPRPEGMCEYTLPRAPESRLNKCPAWGERMKELAHLYPNPKSVPGGIPMVPGTTELRTPDPASPFYDVADLAHSRDLETMGQSMAHSLRLERSHPLSPTRHRHRQTHIPTTWRYR